MEVEWPEYPNHKSELVSHLYIDDFRNILYTGMDHKTEVWKEFLKTIHAGDMRIRR